MGEEAFGGFEFLGVNPPVAVAAGAVGFYVLVQHFVEYDVFHEIPGDGRAIQQWVNADEIGRWIIAAELDGSPGEFRAVVAPGDGGGYLSAEKLPVQFVPDIFQVIAPALGLADDLAGIAGAIAPQVVVSLDKLLYLLLVPGGWPPQVTGQCPEDMLRGGEEHVVQP